MNLLSFLQLPTTENVDIEAEKYYAVDYIERFYIDRVLGPTEDAICSSTYCLYHTLGLLFSLTNHAKNIVNEPRNNG